MKDKKAVLVEVEQLKSIRDELTTEVASLTTDLEKERSSVRSLKDEITKLKVCALCYHIYIQCKWIYSAFMWSYVDI